MVNIFNNYPLVAALMAMILAQTIKLPIQYIITGKLEPMIIFSNGGMPSSHSAFVSSLSTAIGIEYGVESPYFAIAIVFALITMWDAAGIRYQASKHAQVLNILLHDFQNLIEHVKYTRKSNTSFKDSIGSPLKEILGHKPFEVLMGSLFGVTVALISWLIIS